MFSRLGEKELEDTQKQFTATSQGVETIDRLKQTSRHLTQSIIPLAKHIMTHTAETPVDSAAIVESQTSTQSTSRKRGPKGLASSKNAKRKRTEPSDAVTVDQHSKTVALPGDLDDDDEVGQLAALYSTAVASKDPAQARAILNGTVHEADRILRNSPETASLPYEFHWVYASALLDLSLTVDDSTAKQGEAMCDYIEAAIDRCERGLQHGSGPGLDQLNLVKARCITRKSQVDLSRAQEQANFETIMKAMQVAMDMIDGSFKASYYVPLQLARTLTIIQDFADSLIDQDPARHVSINNWVDEKWTLVLTEDQENVSALEGCGRCWLSLAQPYLNQLEDETYTNREETESSASNALQTSVELLSQALKCADKQEVVTGELLCLLAEATISLANTYDEGPLYNTLETTTQELLNRASQLPDFELPERFKDLLDERGDDELATLDVIDTFASRANRKLSVVAEECRDHSDDD